MKAIILTGLLALLRNGADARITASKEDFEVDCGTQPGEINKITFTNPNGILNTIAKIISPNNNAACRLEQNPDNRDLYVLEDVKNKCAIIQASPNSADYIILLRVQEMDWIIQKTDPNFLIMCRYETSGLPNNSSTQLVIVEGDSGGYDPTSSSTYINLANRQQIPPETVEERGVTEINQSYDLLVTKDFDDPTELKNVEFGDDVYLMVRMSGIDEDERGVQVESCEAISGSTRITIIEDYCVVSGLEPLFKSTGFISSGNGSAILPMKAFKLEDGTDTVLQFECMVDVCREVCAGPNCSSVKRRRRSASSDYFLATHTGVLVI